MKLSCVFAPLMDTPDNIAVAEGCGAPGRNRDRTGSRERTTREVEGVRSERAVNRQRPAGNIQRGIRRRASGAERERAARDR